MTRQELLASGIVLAGVACRLAPHPDNFTPVTAAAVFSGAALPSPVSFLVPLVIMAATDWAIGPHRLFWLVWACFLLVSFLGSGIRKKPGPLNIFLATLSGSVLFFVLTNMGVFLFDNMYPKNFEGLLACYAAAIPFFRNALCGDMFYSFCFFSVFYLAKTAYPRREGWAK